MSQYIEKAENVTLPLIAMRDTVAFPASLFNFELTDEADIRAVKYASGTNGLILLVSEPESNAPEGMPPELAAIVISQNEAMDASHCFRYHVNADPDEEETVIYSVGVVARVKQTVQTPEKKFRLIVEGISRATLLTVNEGKEFATATAVSKTIALCDPESVRSRAYLHSEFEALTRVSAYMPSDVSDLLRSARTIRDPGALADFIASHVLIKLEDKQEVLEQYEPFARADALLSILDSEEELLTCAAEIQHKVRARVAQNQKEFYLREQIRVIQDELGEGANAENDRYYRKIISLHLPTETEEKLLKENERLSKTPFGSPEASVITTYLDTVLELPWNKKSHDRVDVAAAQKILDKDHDGLEKVKERILEYLAVKQLHPELKNQVLCLVGAPGVGKTSVGASIARAMKRKYVRVSLGGIRDEADIRGHRKTYLGSMPGRIMTALTQAGTMNPVILLDEIDKMSQSIQGDPASALLEVLDGEQNVAFRDHYLEIPFDLSDCLFIATANTLDTVPHPLLDRMEVIEMHSYTKGEKESIAKNHLIPKQLERHGMTKSRCKIADGVIDELIDYYTREAGVRNLERTLASLIRKAARKIVETGVAKVTINVADVKDYLGPRKLLPEHIDEEDEVGTVNGLAYTEAGGDMLRVEAAILDGTGRLELTGSLGDVMKESARAAISYTRSVAGEYGIAPDFYQKKDIHIHVPEGAVPKDGPSAGVTMLTALVSALTGRPVRHDIAMTGEITLRGRVLPIGGLREKTMAAYSAGVRTVLIPADNERDLADIDPLARENLHFIPCRVAADILKNALV